MSYHISNPSVVWKHVLPVLNAALEGEPIRVSMPLGAAILKFDMQGHQYCIWEVHQTHNESKMYEYTYWLTGTGVEIPGWLLILNQVGSVQNGPFVFHLLEVSDQRTNMEGGA